MSAPDHEYRLETRETTASLFQQDQRTGCNNIHEEHIPQEDIGTADDEARLRVEEVESINMFIEQIGGNIKRLTGGIDDMLRKSEDQRNAQNDTNIFQDILYIWNH